MDYVLYYPDPAEDKQDNILAGIDILGREVLPEVRRRTAS